ncbi:MAG TPA: transposase [Rhodanobacteraceae bacterium]|jgi:REP element-mobilizing transposase RayT
MRSAKAGHRALRKGRYSESGRIYLVTFVTHGRKRWFRNFDLACAVSRTFTPSADAEHAELLCWVLMPDHFHGLIQLHGTRTLSQCVHRLKSQSTRACGGSGRIWAGAYHDHAVRKEEDLRTLARYIVANPVRAGLVESALHYPFWNASWL